MIIEYTIDENDFLTHQLFLASKSDRIKKKRQKNKILVPLVYLTLGLVSIFQDSISMAVTLFIVAILWFFLYPLWESNYYFKHYRNFINENYKNRFGRTAMVEINKNFIIAKDNSSESKILTTELEEINEITSMIFIRLKDGQSLILPKDKITNIDSVIKELQELTTYLKIKYDIDQNWEWK